MIELYFNNIFDEFNIEKNQININIVKSIVYAMTNNNICFRKKQVLLFDKHHFELIWNFYRKSLEFFDPNYNRKMDFYTYSNLIIDAMLYKQKSSFHALFCPGYTKYGYKNYLGNTTVSKLSMLNSIINDNDMKEVFSKVICYYSDVFLENCNSIMEKDWQAQMEYNRQLFHLEAGRYFEKSNIKNMSDLSIFSNPNDLIGYVDEDIISIIPKTTYNAFVKGNEKFYRSLNFSDEQMKYRNDRLITMYRLFSDYLNSLQNLVFLPMENMYERENIFSENNTCVMYLKLKR